MMEAITVSRLNTYIKQIFDAEELLHNIRVVGEVFGVSKTRGVTYFSLKDEVATLSCVCFYPVFEDFIKEGESVVITGNPNYYVKGGKFNFNVVKVESQGQGKLFEEFIAMKEKLEKEGLFDMAHKKAIPQTINRIGVISSREGAVIQDIKNVAWRRNPGVDIVLYNTKVQGINAENEIAHAIRVLGNYEKVDVIMVARGGGSLEDLRAYNTEVVARATYDCPKPIVSAVGHETDFTIIDFVSDLRAPTPSAGAELLTRDLTVQKQQVAQLINRFCYLCNDVIEKKRGELREKILKTSDIIEKCCLKETHNLELSKKSLLNAFEYMINNKNYELGLIEKTLEKINPMTILEKGFAKIEQNGKNISSVKEFLNDEFDVILRDGKIKARQVKGENI